MDSFAAALAAEQADSAQLGERHIVIGLLGVGEVVELLHTCEFFLGPVGLAANADEVGLGGFHLFLVVTTLQAQTADGFPEDTMLVEKAIAGRAERTVSFILN